MLSRLVFGGPTPWARLQRIIIRITVVRFVMPDGSRRCFLVVIAENVEFYVLVFFNKTKTKNKDICWW